MADRGGSSEKVIGEGRDDEMSVAVGFLKTNAEEDVNAEMPSNFGRRAAR
jgi:hypothetical protein